jgi:hypothetical protein
MTRLEAATARLDPRRKLDLGLIDAEHVSLDFVEVVDVLVKLVGVAAILEARSPSTLSRWSGSPQPRDRV